MCWAGGSYIPRGGTPDKHFSSEITPLFRNEVGSGVLCWSMEGYTAPYLIHLEIFLVVNHPYLVQTGMKVIHTMGRWWQYLIF